MRKVSKVVPSCRKVRRVLKPWVRKTIKVSKLVFKGLFYTVAAVAIIHLILCDSDSKEVINTSSITNYSVMEVAVVNTEVSNGESSIEEEKVEEVVEEVKEVKRTNYACSSSSVKTYMNYKAITNKSSTQWKYITNHMTVGDGNIGVALGSHFGSIGSKYEVVLDTGITFNVVKIEAKADRHVNNGCQHKTDGSVIEFVIDSSKMKKSSNGYVWSGNFNNNPDFKGKIKAMYKID